MFKIMLLLILVCGLLISVSSHTRLFSHVSMVPVSDKSSSSTTDPDVIKESSPKFNTCNPLFSSKWFSYRGGGDGDGLVKHFTNKSAFENFMEENNNNNKLIVLDFSATW